MMHFHLHALGREFVGRRQIGKGVFASFDTGCAGADDHGTSIPAELSLGAVYGIDKSVAVQAKESQPVIAAFVVRVNVKVRVVQTGYRSKH
jgi:hypothetical protein